MVANIDVDVEILNGRVTPPPKVSSHRSSGYELIAQSLRQTFGDIVVLPGLTLAGTDSKQYGNLAWNSYRINPFVLGLGLAISEVDCPEVRETREPRACCDRLLRPRTLSGLTP